MHSIVGDEESCQFEKTCSDPDCKICNEKMCFQCFDKFALNSKGKCVAATPHCNFLKDESDKCNECFEGYFITSEYKCEKSDTSNKNQSEKIIMMILFLLILGFLSYVIYIRYDKMKKETDADDYVSVN